MVHGLLESALGIGSFPKTLHTRLHTRTEPTLHLLSAPPHPSRSILYFHANPAFYRGTSLIRNNPLLGPCSRTVSRAI